MGESESMDGVEHYISFAGGGYSVSGVVTAADWARIQSGSESWVQVQQAQSADEDGRVIDFGEISVLFCNGVVAERSPETPERR